MSNTGYLKDSPDRFNPMNVIPSRNITMKNVPHPVLGIDNKGNVKLMTPGKDYKFKGNQVTEIPLRQTGQRLDHGVLQNGGNIKQYQNGDEYIGELSPGMMFNPFENEGYNEDFRSDFKPSPIQQMSNFEFDKNQVAIDKDRAPQVSNILRDQSQMVDPIRRSMEEVPEFNLTRPRIDDTIKFPNQPMKGVVDDRQKYNPQEWSGMEYAMTGLIGLGAFNQVLQNKNKDFYDQQMRKFGNTNAMNSNNPRNPYGDFTLNNSVGSNFRPNSYQDGGEYDLSEAEIDRLRNEGYDIEFL